VEKLNDNSNPDKVAKFSAQALGLMTEHSVPTTPQNYQVWYAYTAQSNPDLNVDMDFILRKNEGFTEALNSILFERYFGTEGKLEAYTKANDEFRAEISQVMAHIAEASGDATRYRESLEGYSDELDENAGVDVIRAMLGNLVSETRTMAEQSQRLESELSESSKRIVDLEKNLESVEKESQTDALTGIANRKCFDNTLDQAIQAAASEKSDLSLIMADIDFFKKFNDKWGHQLGDQVLRLVGQTLRNNAGDGNLAARYGGEEFSIVLPGVTLHDAAKVAETIRSVMMTKQLTNKTTNEPLGRITMSLGVAQLVSGETDEALLKRADEALYTAKKQGRNRVEYGASS
jgi:diguanylate cyclase